MCLQPLAQHHNAARTGATPSRIGSALAEIVRRRKRLQQMQHPTLTGAARSGWTRGEQVATIAAMAASTDTVWAADVVLS